MKKVLRRNPKIPWETYERYVRSVLASAGRKMNLNVQGKRTIQSGGDEYEVDAYAEIEVFGGAIIKVIVECKRYTKPVNRDLVMTLHRKTQELGAHKGMLFSTSGFQRGAVSYAQKHGIALVKLASRGETYVTRYFGVGEFSVVGQPSSHYENTELVCLLHPAPNTFTVIGPSNPRPLIKWLMAPPPGSGDEELVDDPTPEIDAPGSDDAPD